MKDICETHPKDNKCPAADHKEELQSMLHSIQAKELHLLIPQCAVLHSRNGNDREMRVVKQPTAVTSGFQAAAEVFWDRRLTCAAALMQLGTGSGCSGDQVPFMPILMFYARSLCRTSVPKLAFCPEFVLILPVQLLGPAKSMVIIKQMHRCQCVHL